MQNSGLAVKPPRIVSLLASATEMVCALGLREHLVGRSHCCDYPGDIGHLPVVTHTRVPYTSSSQEIDRFVRTYLGDHAALYQLNVRLLRELRPDVIISQQLCDVCAVSTEEVNVMLSSLPGNPRLIDLKPESFGEVIDDIARVARALDVRERGQQLLNDLNSRVDAVAARNRRLAREERPRVAMLEWLLPPFNCGHWNPELIELAGGQDCLGYKGRPSTTMSWQQVRNSGPDVVLIAGCGLTRERVAEDLAHLASDPEWPGLLNDVAHRVLWVDGQRFFSKPSPSLVDAMEALAHALHPGLHPPAARAEVLPVDPMLLMDEKLPLRDDRRMPIRGHGASSV